MTSALDVNCQFCDADKESAVPHEMKSLRLRVANMCCAGEENTIRQVLNGFKEGAIEYVSVNVIGRYAVLKHCPQKCCAPVDRIIKELNDKMLGVSIQESFDDSGEESKEEAISALTIGHLALICALFVFAAAYEFSHYPLLPKDHMYEAVALSYIICGFFGVLPILIRAVEVVARGSIDINILVLFATFSSFIAHDFRDGALVITLFNAAKILEEFVMYRVRNAIKISASNVGRFALRIEGAEQKSCLLEDLRIGDRVALRAGDMIPVDGDVTTGQAVVDESAITGEAAPVHKAVGSSVVSGGILQNGYLEVCVKVEVKDSVMRKLNDTVDEVQARKGAFATLVDRFAAYWVPVIVAASGIFIVIGGFVTGEWKSSLSRGLVLMLLACPCSIVLAAPVASLSTIAVAAKHGVIVKGSEVLESLGSVDTVAVDKTGTMTKGNFSVLGSMRFTTDKEEDEDEVDGDMYNPVKLAAALENKSAHPLANAIIREFTDCVTEMDQPFPESRKVKTLEGIGVSGWVDIPSEDPVHVAVGNEKLFKGHEKMSLGTPQDGLSSSDAGKKAGSVANKLGGKCVLKKGQVDQLKGFADKWIACSIVYVTVDDELALCMALGDVVRPEAHATVRQLTGLGCKVVMLTGDAGPVASKLCKELNIQDCRSRLHPEEKYQYVHQLKLEGKRVAMIGDGINDTTALAAACVGVAMGAGGAAMAVHAADVVLMSDNLTKLPATISMAKRCNSIIMQNIILSVGIKVTAMILAMLGYLVLWEAICVDIGSLFIVLLNGLRPMHANVYEMHDTANPSGDTNGDTPSTTSEPLGERRPLLSSENDTSNAEAGKTYSTL